MIPKDEVAARLAAVESNIQYLQGAIQGMISNITQMQQLMHTIEQKLPQKTWYTKSYTGGTVGPNTDAIWRWT